MVVFKESGMSEGVFLCKVIDSDREPEHIMVLKEEKFGEWRPYEFEEEKEKSSS
ncbi:hypothetical protein [Halalkalibacterium halodurans]|uniref:hypothetical protein n=1 Tax=Halalkalibacterium halodurans TaxID=86665 RepID=UPI002AAA4A83|nr:hypothetical protein [Halalkalibacterium halodurans]MDY7224608.1 hypothetical protein [Halalkalibacterium halodurans]MDY7240731.1 hypothetical protein [Halalkalibacterium halodurans]